MSRPFLSTAFHVRWSTLTPDHIQADIGEALEIAARNIDALTGQDRGKMTFASVILALEEALRPLNEAWTLVQHLDAVCNSPALREAHNAMLPEVSAFRAKIPLNEHLWDLLVTYSKTDDARRLPAVQKRALAETMDDFRRAGADLPPEKKKRLEALESELSLVTQKYSENVLDSTNKWELVLDDTSRLAGLPASSIAAAMADAKAKGHGSEDAPKYRFTLQAPSMIPVFEYAEDDALRRQFWEGTCAIGRGGEHDNTALVWKILGLRREKALLMGKASFADLVLEHRMARSGKNALGFVEDLHAKVRPAFERETVELQEFRAEKLHADQSLFEPWEIAWWAEKRRHALFDFDPEELRPYFPLDQVLSGMFALAEKVFDLRITARETVFHQPGKPGLASSAPDEAGPVEVWHPQVKFFEVRNERGVHLGSFYADWHPRESKRGGAWMNCLVGGLPPADGRDRRLHLGLICGNMTPPLDGKPALITHDEACTVFHEFGHLLHQICGNVEIASLNGTSVYWDFVELPSQLLENFCWERESLDIFARHYQTGEPIPARLFKKMIAARNYRSASAIMRQLSFGKLDLELHMRTPPEGGEDLDALAREILRHYLMPLKTDPPTMARRFGHLFSSPLGYAAGYYSYKWAEVLDADAFSRFQKEGVLNPAVGRAFRDTILSKGNSEDPAKLFRDFMGRDPDPAALLRRAGLA